MIERDSKSVSKRKFEREKKSVRERERYSVSEREGDCAGECK